MKQHQKEHLESVKKLTGKTESLKQENDTLTAEIKTLKDQHVAEKDKIYGELISLKQQFETALADVERSEAAYKRIVEEKELLQAQTCSFSEENANLKARVEEQLAIHNHLKSRLETVQRTNSEQAGQLSQLQEELAKRHVSSFSAHIHRLEAENRDFAAKITSLELERDSLTHHRNQIELTCQNAIKDRASMKHQVTALELEIEQLKSAQTLERNKTADQVRSETEREQLLLQLQDDVKMLNISCQTKDETISGLQEKFKKAELTSLKRISINLDQESKTNYLEKVQELEQRNRSIGQQLIEVGQDKRLLVLM